MKKWYVTSPKAFKQVNILLFAPSYLLNVFFLKENWSRLFFYF